MPERIHNLLKKGASGRFIFFLIFILAFYFRFTGLNWDSGTHLHPDERAIVMNALPLSLPKNISEFLSPESPLNPHFFPYGNLPLYLLKLSGNAAGLFKAELSTYNGIELVGRYISVVADLGTLFLVYKISKILFEQRTALASSFVYSISVFPIQASHFYAVDILLTFFMTLTLFSLINLYSKPTIKNAALAGISFGLALATKISAIPLLAATIAATSLDFFLIFLKTPHIPKKWFPHFPPFLKRLAKDIVVIGIFTSLTFVICQPYTIIDFKEFIRDSLLQSQMTRDPYTFPYTLQYVGKIPYLYELKNLFLWGQGPAVFIVCFLGIILFVLNRRTSINRKNESLVVLFFMLTYFLIVGKFAVGWMRYMLPLYPLLAIFGGSFLIFIVDWIKKINFRLFGVILLTLLFITLLLWPFSFVEIYKRANTRVAATDWINKNVPLRSNIAVEHWDDALPLYTTNQYNNVVLTLYDQPDGANKWTLLSAKIKKSDYIIISSNRLYVPLQKLEDCTKFRECYPRTAEYYRDLFSGKLGFEKIAEFTSYPQVPIINLSINDQTADESFTVIDHPKVMIFKRVGSSILAN